VIVGKTIIIISLGHLAAGLEAAGAPDLQLIANFSYFSRSAEIFWHLRLRSAFIKSPLSYANLFSYG
jgi:hypothetical protein